MWVGFFGFGEIFRVAFSVRAKQALQNCRLGVVDRSLFLKARLAGNASDVRCDLRTSLVQKIAKTALLIRQSQTEYGPLQDVAILWLGSIKFCHGLLPLYPVAS